MEVQCEQQPVPASTRFHIVSRIVPVILVVSGGGRRDESGIGYGSIVLKCDHERRGVLKFDVRLRSPDA
jgi:hypothetical protein